MFLTVNDQRLETEVFWLAWSFATPINLVVGFGLIVWGTSSYGEVKSAPALLLAAIFSAVFVFVGIIFMYANIVRLTFLIILLAMLSVGYIVGALYIILGVGHIVSQEKNTKGKVVFLRLIKSDVDGLILVNKNAGNMALLNALSEKIRFSDPMSPKETVALESQICALIAELSAKLSADPTQDVSSTINQAMILLDNRNRMCLALK